MRLAPLSPKVTLLTAFLLSSVASNAFAQGTPLQPIDAALARNAYTAGFEGHGWTVAILDTGGFATSSPGLAGKIAGEGCVNVDAQGTGCPNGQPTMFAGGAATVAWPNSAVGTEMAELITNTNTSALGVAPGARIYPIRIGGSASGASSTDVRVALENIYYNLRSQFAFAAVVIPPTVGGGETSANLCGDGDLRYVIQALRDAGVVVVSGSGDGGLRNGIQSDQCRIEVATVGAFNADNTPAANSNFSENVAFGVITGPNLVSYAGDGAPKMLPISTSFSAAMAAGAAAVLKTKRPTAGEDAIVAALKAGGLPVMISDPTAGSPLPQYAIRRIDSSNALAYLIGDYTPENGFWWNPNESGRGYFVDVQGNAMFFGIFAYNGGGQPEWYVGRITETGPGAFAGNVYLYGGGQMLSSSTYVPPTSLGAVANVQLNFANDTNGTMTIQTTQATSVVQITKYRVFYDNQPNNLQRPQTGWYWDPTKSGSGIAIEALGNSMFMVPFAYDASGHSQWTATAGSTLASQFAVSTQPGLYVNGQTLTGPYSPPSIAAQPYGMVQIRTLTPHGLSVVFDSGMRADFMRFGFLD